MIVVLFLRIVMHSNRHSSLGLGDGRDALDTYIVPAETPCWYQSAVGAGGLGI